MTSSSVYTAFSDQARLTWLEYLASPAHTNRSRPDIYKTLLINNILNGIDTGDRPMTAKERRLKHQVKIRYRLQDGRVQYQRAEEPYRFVVTDDQVYDLVIQTHLKLQHAGRDKTFEEIDMDYYGVTKKEVAMILGHCSTCIKKSSQKQKGKLRPIVVTDLWERVQVDLIDMSSQPDEEFRWICHIKDHFSKYSMAYALPNKESDTVVRAIQTWILHFGPFRILHCDNGTEFKGSVLDLAQKYDIKVINGRARHPQSQGLVEQGNGVFKQKLAAWQEDNDSSEWVSAIPDIILAMNTQRHSVTRKSPYEIVFGQRIYSGIPLIPAENVENEEEELVPGDYQIHDNNSFGDPVLEVRPSQHGSLPSIPIDPSLLTCTEVQSDTIFTSSSTVTLDIFPLSNIDNRAAVRASVRAASTLNRAQMVQRNLKNNPTPIYHVGDLVSVRVPKADRKSTDNKRIIGRVLSIPHSDTYQVQTEYGTLKRLVPIRDLEGVPDSINFSLKSGNEDVQLTLRMASRLDNSRSAAPNIMANREASGDELDTITVSMGTQSTKGRKRKASQSKKSNRALKR